MNKKRVVFLARIFRRKTPVTCRPARVPTLGTQITAHQPPRANDDYSRMFQGF